MVALGEVDTGDTVAGNWSTTVESWRTLVALHKEGDGKAKAKVFASSPRQECSTWSKMGAGGRAREIWTTGVTGETIRDRSWESKFWMSSKSAGDMGERRPESSHASNVVGAAEGMPVGPESRNRRHWVPVMASIWDRVILPVCFCCNRTRKRAMLRWWLWT